MMRKILYSPGYGAGWTTWNSSNQGVRKYLLEYQPIIDFLEAGGEFGRDEVDGYLDKNLHIILKKLKEECLEKFGTTIYTGGADQLKVAEVEGEVRIDEYDGYESFVTRSTDDGWL